MFKSFFNWKVLLNLLGAIAVFVILVWLTFKWLAFHTNHGQEMLVPNVTNQSVQKAISIIENSGLTVEVDSFDFNAKYKPYQVLNVFPIPGSHVKPGTPVKLLVNPSTWAPVAIPDVINAYKFRAFDKLKLVGLQVGDTLYEPSIAKDAVLKLMYNGKIISPGELVPRFSKIDVVIGQGPKRNIRVPNLVGLTLQEAQSIIKQNLFVPGLFFDENDQITSHPSWTVFYQNPSAGSISDQGIQVDLWISDKTPAEMHNKILELDRKYRPNAAPSVPIEPTIPNPEDTLFQSKPPSAKPAGTDKKLTEAAKKAEDKSKKGEEKPKKKKVIVD